MYKTTLAIALASISSPAVAQVYVSAHGGLSSPETVRHELDKNVTLIANPDDGYRIGGAIGYDFGNFKLEIEGSHAAATMPYITDGKLKGITTARDHRRDAIMANVYWTPTINKNIKLLLGIGGGVSDNFMRAAEGNPCSERAALRYTVNPKSDRTGPTGKECVDQGKSGNRALTGQVIAGLDFRFTETSRWSLSPQFRAVRSFGVTQSAKHLPTRQLRNEKQVDPTTYEALFALTYRFGTPSR